MCSSLYTALGVGCTIPSNWMWFLGQSATGQTEQSATGQTGQTGQSTCALSTAQWTMACNKQTKSKLLNFLLVRRRNPGSGIKQQPRTLCTAKLHLVLMTQKQNKQFFWRSTLWCRSGHCYQKQEILALYKIQCHRIIEKWSHCRRRRGEYFCQQYRIHELHLRNCPLPFN